MAPFTSSSGISRGLLRANAGLVFGRQDAGAAVVRCEINLNDLAGDTLAGRGLDQNGIWVGFPEAVLQNERRRQT